MEEKVSSKDLIDELMSRMTAYLMFREYYIGCVCKTITDMKTSLDMLYDKMPGAKLKFLGVIRKQIETMQFIDEERDNYLKKLSRIRKLAKEEMKSEKIKNKFSKEDDIRKDRAEEK